MRTIFLTLLFTTILSAQEKERALAILSIQGGIDHIENVSTDPLMRASALFLLTPAFHVTLDVQKTLPFSLLTEVSWQLDEYLGVEAAYLLQNYEEYHTREHNMITTASLQRQDSRVGGAGEIGINLRFVDYDGEDHDAYAFFIWEGALLYDPVHFLDLQLAIGNSHNSLPVSMGYIELALKSSWQLIEQLSLTADLGTAWSGTASLAGYTNRFFAQGGVSYAFPLR